MANLDPLFGIHAGALSFQRRRMEMLAANIANADTPGYQARDLDFQKALAAAGNQSGLAVTNSQHLPLTEQVMKSATVYRVPLQPSMDGNTVDLQVEQAQFADAALHYQASLSFMDGRLRSLLTAITGN